MQKHQAVKITTAYKVTDQTRPADRRQMYFPKPVLDQVRAWTYSVFDHAIDPLEL